MSKLGFRFHAVPRDRHPEWFELTHAARATGLELYVAICDDKTGVAETAVAGNWKVSLCKLLRIEPSERQGVCRHFEAMERHGLIVASEGRVTLLFRASDRRPQAEVKPGSSDTQAEVKPGPSQGQAGVKLSVTVGNDSTPISQTEETDKKRGEERERERAPARGLSSVPEQLTAMQVGVEVMAEWNPTLTWNNGHRNALEEIGLKPPAEREAVMASLRTDSFLRQKPFLVDPAYVAKQWNRLMQRTLAADAPQLAATAGTPWEQAHARSRAAERAYRAADADTARKHEAPQLRAAWVEAAKEADALREKCA